MTLRPSQRLASGTFAVLAPSQRLVPPHQVAPIGEQGLSSAAWIRHHQDVVDRLADLADRLAKIEARLTAAGIP